MLIAALSIGSVGALSVSAAVYKRRRGSTTRGQSLDSLGSHRLSQRQRPLRFETVSPMHDARHDALGPKKSHSATAVNATAAEASNVAVATTATTPVQPILNRWTRASRSVLPPGSNRITR
jgi:hypothetical protein